MGVYSSPQLCTDPQFGPVGGPGLWAYSSLPTVDLHFTPNLHYNECPRALLCLVYCAGRAQSCFLTILRIPSALLTRLAPASCTLHSEFYTVPIAAPHPCICAYSGSFAPRYKINLYCTPQQAHARQHQPQPHMRRIACIPAAAPDTFAMRRHVRAHTYNTNTRIHDCACASDFHSHLGRGAV